MTKSASGRTEVETTMDRETGAFVFVAKRDGRVVHRYELNRELDLNKE